MPIYEYRCHACDHKSSFFVRSVNKRVDAVCPQCGSEDMSRLISPVSFRSSGRSSGGGTDYYSDPSNIGKHVEDSFRRSGIDMPESVHQNIDNARRGKMPEGLDI